MTPLPVQPGWEVVAAVAAAVAAALLVPHRPWLVPRPRRPGPPGLALCALCALVVGVVVPVTGIPTTAVALLLVVSGAGVGAAAVLRARSRGRVWTDTERRVLEVCEHLAGELATGQPPGTALDRVAAAWAPLRPVAEAFRVGSDVPTALREVAATPGADDLRRLAAAWEVAHRTGHGLGEAVDRVAVGLRSARATRRVVQGELASARATARLVGALPLLALAMGSGAGGDPWRFLLATPAGLACLAAGSAIGLAGLAWIEAIARGVEGQR